MLYRHNIDGCFDQAVGIQGITAAQLAKHLDALSPAWNALKARSDAAAAPLLALPGRTDDLAQIETLAADIKKRFKHVIVCGSGGSGLSGRLFKAMAAPITTPSVHFLETIDPDVGETVLARCNPADTCFIFISKSGTTVETVGYFYAFLSRLGDRAKDHVVMITMDTDNPLRRAAKELGCRIIAHAPDIGGRFSVLTAVGLLPAAILGLDIRALRRGAATVLAKLDAAEKQSDFCPAVGAALHAACAEKNMRTSVFFTYAERLSGLAAWWRQSWAESLGKGGKGTTPIRAMGTTDQHSQLQIGRAHV